MPESSNRFKYTHPKAKFKDGAYHDSESATDVPVENNDDKAHGEIAMMSFNMPKEWHKRFKLTAIRKGVSMKHLFEDSFKALEALEAFDKCLAEIRSSRPR